MGQPYANMQLPGFGAHLQHRLPLPQHFSPSGHSYWYECLYVQLITSRFSSVSTRCTIVDLGATVGAAVGVAVTVGAAVVGAGVA